MHKYPKVAVVIIHWNKVEYLQKFYQLGKKIESPKVRPGLRDLNTSLVKAKEPGSFKKYLNEGLNG